MYMNYKLNTGTWKSRGTEEQTQLPMQNIDVSHKAGTFLYTKTNAKGTKMGTKVY
jgi:hypothetical protein